MPSAGCQASPSGLASSSTSTRRLTAFDGGSRPVLSANVAIGARSTPTPTGRFYVNQRFRDDPRGPYGWAAIGISAFSEVLHGWPQGGPIASRHQPTVTARPAGLERLHPRQQRTVKRLWRLAPTGTPVQVRLQGSPRPGKVPPWQRRSRTS